MSDVIRCAILPPRPRELLGMDSAGIGHSAECLRVFAHLGPHVLKHPDGSYIAWENDYECECCDPEDPYDHCYVHWKLDEVEALELIERQT